jgi:hypothetical protein
MPPRPWLPITIRSAGQSFAALTISVSGLPTGTKSSAVDCGGGVYELGVDDMNERHLRPREARQLGTDISRMRRDGLVVDSNENSSKEHNSLPGPCRHA